MLVAFEHSCTIRQDVSLKTKNDLMSGRTHGQHALPITFGFKVACWIDEISRHIERINSIEKLCESFNLSVQVLNKNDLILKNKEIILINSYGDLLTYFKFAQGVFMGKSTLKNLERVGGQNPIEPAKLGCKVYHGPYVYNFEEIYKVLGEHNIAKKINSPESLANNLANDFEAKEDNYSKFSDIMEWSELNIENTIMN